MKITLCVFSIHLVVTLLSLFFNVASPPPPPHLKIHTFLTTSSSQIAPPSPPVDIPLPVVAPLPPAEPPIVVNPPKPTSSKKRVASSPPALKKTAVKPKTTPSTNRAKAVAKKLPSPPPQKDRGKMQHLLAESLQSLERSTKKMAPITSKIAIESLKSNSKEFLPEYEEMLAGTLQALLEFPEQGEMKLQIWMNRQGKVERLTVQESTSPTNTRYIHQALPTLILPPFGKFYKGEEKHLFSLTLITKG